MNRSTRRWMIPGAIAAVVVMGNAQGVAAQAGRAPERADDPPAVAYRKSVMDALVAHVASLRVLLASGIHEADVRKHSAALLASAMMFDGIFAAGSTGGASNAKEDIWANSEDFKARMQVFQEAAKTLDDEVARNLGRSQTYPRLQMLIGTCGGCHTAFKLPAPLPF